MSERLEDQIRRQTRAMFEEAPPFGDLLPPEMAETFDFERTPKDTITLKPVPPRRTVRAWVASAAAAAFVLAISIPTLIWLTGSDQQPATRPPTTVEPPRSGMLQNPDNGHHYEAVVSNQALEWADARAEAEARSFRGAGGHLVTITSTAEDRFVQQAFAAILDRDPWLGGYQLAGNDEPAEGWRWVTGEPFEYTNWGVGVPDDEDGADCLQYLPGPEPYWNDFGCGAGPGSVYIVEYDTRD